MQPTTSLLRNRLFRFTAAYPSATVSATSSNLSVAAVAFLQQQRRDFAIKPSATLRKPPSNTATNTKQSPIMALLAPGPDNLFAKMTRGEIPCNKVAENEHWLAFLDINPLSKGHTLIVPKCVAAQAHEIPSEYMATFGPFLSRVIKAVVPAGMHYNILQNNGSEAHQVVMHVHFHIIPKTDESSGLKMEWNAQKSDAEELKKQAEEYRKAFDATA